ncbi:MAG: hypothetical protein OEZ13_12470 [Spirochaetia bacterium]|nr:hypothetical protein [Spirochaetia bacterium]
MKESVVITPEESAFGFRLAGISHFSAAKENISELIRKISKEDKYSFVAVDERLIDDEVEEIINELEEKWDGVIVILPAPAQSEKSKEDYISKLVRKAIGYHVRLEL